MYLRQNKDKVRFNIKINFDELLKLLNMLVLIIKTYTLVWYYFIQKFIVNSNFTFNQIKLAKQ